MRYTLLSTLLLAACSTPRNREPAAGASLEDAAAGPPRAQPAAPPEGEMFEVRAPAPPALLASVPIDFARLAGLFAEIELARIRGDAAALFERYIDEANAALSLSPDAPGTRLANLPRSATEARLLAALSTQDDEEAWRLLKLILDSDPQYGMVQVAMGILYERWKIPHQARQAYERSLRVLPGSPFARLGLARLARGSGATAAARAALESLVEEVPGYAAAHYELGSLLRELGHAKLARLTLESAAALDPGYFLALKELGEVRTQLGFDEGAVAAYRAAVAIHPADRPLQLALAKLLEQQGDIRGAALAYEAGMLDAAPDPDLLRSIGKLYKVLGDAARETATLERLVKRDAKDGVSWRRLAILRTSDGQPEAAEKAWRAAIAAKDDDGTAYYGLARLMRAKGNLRESLGHLRAAVAHGGGPEAAQDLAALEKDASVPHPALANNDVNALYKEAFWSLRRFYKARLAADPKLGGKLGVKVSVNDDGTASDAEIVEDSVKDALLETHLYWALHDAQYPRGRRDYTFKFELSPGAQ